MLSNSLVQNLIGVFVALAVITIGYFKWTYQYWKRRNLPYLEPRIFYGNIAETIKRKETFGITMQKIYNEMKRRNWKHGGIFFTVSPTYVVTDLDYVKNILAKDFQHFVDRGLYYNEEADPLSAHLFAIGGNKWRNLRVKLTPTFTSGKMKMMFQTLVDCEEHLLAKVRSNCEQKNPVDIKDVLGRYTTNIIGSCAFGLDLKTFDQDNSPFREYGKKIFTTTKVEGLVRTFANSFPDVAEKLGVKVVTKEVSDFFMKVVKDTVSYREKNNYTRKDFMQLLIDLKNNKAAEEDGYKHDGKTLTLDEIAAQSFVFFAAGFETSSTTMTFTLYELAKNQDIQQRLRDEVNTVLSKHEGKVTYEAIQEMKYMNQVIDETLRKYPPVPLLTRKCVVDYKVPDEDIVIEKGTLVIVPVLGIHRDPDYYPEPEKFDPERFNETNKSSRHHYAHIPFGEGPRNCIGLRFGLMQSKVGLTSLLRNYKFTVNEKTKEPLKMQADTIILAVDGDVWLNVEEV